MLLNVCFYTPFPDEKSIPPANGMSEGSIMTPSPLFLGLRSTLKLEASASRVSEFMISSFSAKI